MHELQKLSFTRPIGQNFYTVKKSLFLKNYTKNKSHNFLTIYIFMEKCSKCGSIDFYVYGSRRSCKPCTRTKSSKRYHTLSPENLNIFKARSKQWQVDNHFRYYWLLAKGRAKKKNREFTITPEHIEQLFQQQDGKCFYSGLKMTIHDKKEQYGISVDRRDSSKGYTPDNIVLCCLQANLMKNEYSEENFLSMIKAIYNHQNTAAL